ncbi:MAG: cyclic nucleotide-binding domain-containing protein, partial [Blastocatellia bacterium]
RDAAEYTQFEPGRRRHRLEETAARVLKRFRSTTSLAERLEMIHVATGYEMGIARCLSSQKVLAVLDELARVESTPWYIVDKMRRQYKEKYEAAQREVTRTTERYPRFINDLQERLAQRLLLLARASSYARQVEHGTLSPEVAESLQNEIRGELRALRASRVAPLELELIDLLRRWIPFQALSNDDLAYVAIRINMRVVPEAEAVVKQADLGSSMYFLAHGVVRLSREENGASKDVASLMAGDYFGESAVLRGEPYRGTVTAMTDCSIYELERTDLRIAMDNNPRILAAIEQYTKGSEETILESNFADIHLP